MRDLILLLVFAIGVAVHANAQDGPLSPGVKFLTPDEAIAKMSVPEGFAVNAFAAEPRIVQPFAFTFDGRGRVWLLENLNYETRGSDTFDQGPKGRIVILTDTDGDGRADERKVFADKLFFPTGIALGFGGVWVGSPPNLMFIADRDHDDVPDGDPVVVLDGWGRQDRHETLNSFTWGPDGWLYGCQGVFTHSRVGKPGTPDEERTPINAGVWRFHPVTGKFEVFAWGTSNPWGLDFDEQGQMFLTACVIPHLWHMIQGGRYHRQSGPHFGAHVYDDIKTIADHRHASAHGGARFYLADQFPAEYRGRLFMCNIHEHGVLVDVVKRAGSGFTGSHGEHFSMANDAQWLGFNMELGPDGSMYVIDWHDEDICGRKVLHQQTGRLWRYSYGDPAYPIGFDLAARSDDDLIENLSDANQWTVRQAQRLLQERAADGTLAKDTPAELRARFARNDVPESLRLRMLWALHVTGGADDAWLAGLMDSPLEHLRAWAVQLMAEDGVVAGTIREKWSSMAREDPSPLVRLYLASALQRIPLERRWPVLEGLVSHADDRDDHNLPLMIWYALEPMVIGDPGRAIELAARSKIDLVSNYVARRITNEIPAMGGGRIADAERAPAADSVSDEGLVLHLGSDAFAGSAGRVEHWGEAVQKLESAQPRIETSLAGRRALVFDGVDDRLEIASDAELAFSAEDDFTLAAWVFAEQHQSSWAAIVTRSRDRAPWYGFWIDPGGRWYAGASESGSLAGPRAQPGWHHLALVQRGGKDRALFVNGYRVANGAATDANGGGALWIGGAASVAEPFRGGINEIRIYRRALAPGEVSFLADNALDLTTDERDEPNEAFADLIVMLGASNNVRVQNAVLTGIRDGLAGNSSVQTPPTWTGAYAALAKSPDAGVRDAARELSVILGDEASLAALRETMMNHDRRSAERRGALETLVQKRVSNLARDLHRLLRENELRRPALQGLATLPDPATPAAILREYSKFAPQEKIDAVNTLASRPAFGLALLAAIESGAVPRTDVNATVARQLDKLGNPEVSAKLRDVWGEIRATPAGKEKLFARYRRLLKPNNLRKADAKLGRAVFDKSCGQCHALFGSGGNIGPDITGSDRRNTEYILENVLDPNGAIGKDYQYSTFSLNDERVLLGIISAENDRTVTVKTLTGTVTIAKNEINERQQLPVSMMPDGLFQTLTDTEVRDLVRYLQAEGQVE